MQRRSASRHAEAGSQAPGTGRPGRLRVRELVGRLSLAQRFALACLLVLVTGAVVIGRWVSGEIESGVIRRTSAVTALYVDSFVSPHLQNLEEDGGLSPAHAADLRGLLEGTSLGETIVSFKVWSTDGEVLFATNRRQVGERYPITNDLRRALGGSIHSELSNLDEVENRLERDTWGRLVETYLPVFSHSGDGSVTSIVEFYQVPDELLAEVRRSQRDGWAIVGTSTVVMYVLLVGLVAGASRTITRQNRSLKTAFDQQATLEQRIRALNQRLRRAAGTKAQTDEQVLQRIMQDLHDGPTQDLSLALLRFEDLRRPGAPPEESEVLETVEFAVRHALEEVRDITTGLRLPQLEGLSWRETVEKAVAEHERRTGTAVHCEAHDVPEDPTPAQRIAAYRVTQEALSNAAHHSGTGEQWVKLVREGDWVTITVQDRGTGFELGQESSTRSRRARLGLQGMRDRTELLGGTFNVTSAPGRGTLVEARIPLRQGEDNVR